MRGPDRAVDRIEMRWLPTDAIDAAAWLGLTTLLDRSEQLRAAAFRDPRDAQSFIAAHALLRGMVARRLGMAPAALRFRPGPNGKPELVEQPFARPLGFSLSHTRGLVVAATAFGDPVGVDAEAIADDRPDPDLAARILAPSEIRLLECLPAAAIVPTIFELWTLKEAYAKATGDGLPREPSSIAFTLGPPRLQAPAQDDTDPTGWRFATWRFRRSHVAALAFRAAADDQADIDIAQCDPAELTADNSTLQP